jgi:transcriptional regulator with XRE-family HTH domain
MPMIDESARVRIIRALLGIDAKVFAAKLGVTPSTVSNWENGRRVPAGRGRKALGELCESAGITFTPNGFPVPADEIGGVPEEMSGVG